MKTKKSLGRKVQCSKCPWKKDSDPNGIPDGYCVSKHRALKKTIAKPGDWSTLGKPIHVMACHESIPGNEMHCIGWLVNQLEHGNNIPLRLSMARYDLRGVRTVGEQHESFEDTLPKEVKE